MTITDRIDVNPEIMMGKPVIRGTRVTVELILRKLGEGATESDLLDAYPQLKSKTFKPPSVTRPTRSRMKKRCW